MAGLKNIKLKIQSVKKTRQVTKAMEAVSAVKMRKSQERALTARPYARAAMRMLRELSDVRDLTNHALFAQKEEGDTAIILVTSDKGLAGSLNSAVLKTVETFMYSKDFGKGGVLFLCLGRRGLEFAKRRGYEVVYEHTNVSDEVRDEHLTELTQKAIELFRSGRVRKVNIVYTNFRSTFEQDAIMRRLLPLSRAALEEIVAGITPEKGKFAEEQSNGNGVAHYTIEPSADEVIDEVLPLLVNVAVFHALLEAKASEHSARMVAMKNATDKAGEVAKDLNLAFNKARQAAITAEVSEITSGIEAMR